MKNTICTILLGFISVLALTAKGYAIDLYDTTDDTTGAIITVQGENISNPPYYESRYEAFDNHDSTKWLDFADNFPDTRSTWIQFQYANDNKYKVFTYTLTSANDAPERDPTEWYLLGKNDTTSTVKWDTLTMEYDAEFFERFEKQEFVVNTPGLYNIYRLAIVAVYDPSTANSMQIAEIELIGLREDELVTGIENGPFAPAPQQFSLENNYPNPFNPKTEIAYSIAESCPVQLSVYDILGREIVKLVDQFQSAGTYTVSWNGTDVYGKVVPSGVYLYRIQAGSFSQSHKMLLVK